MTAALLLAYDPNDIRPGWVALGIVVALAVATFLLWRSMNSQLRRIDVPTKKELAEHERADVDQEAESGGSAPQDKKPSNGTKP